MSDGILNDQGFDAIRMSECHPKADRSPVVLHVERVPGQVQRRREVVYHLGDVVEGVREILGCRCIAVPEAWIVGSDHVKPGHSRVSNGSNMRDNNGSP